MRVDRHGRPPDNPAAQSRGGTSETKLRRLTDPLVHTQLAGGDAGAARGCLGAMQSAEAVAEGLSQDLVPFLKPFSVYSYLARHITEKARHQDRDVIKAGTPQRQHCSARPCDITPASPAAAPLPAQEPQLLCAQLQRQVSARGVSTRGVQRAGCAAPRQTTKVLGGESNRGLVTTTPTLPRSQGQPLCDGAAHGAAPSPGVHPGPRAVRGSMPGALAAWQPGGAGPGMYSANTMVRCAQPTNLPSLTAAASVLPGHSKGSAASRLLHHPLCCAAGAGPPGRQGGTAAAGRGRHYSCAVAGDTASRVWG